MVEGSFHNSFVHALLSKGRLLYTHDETIADLCERLRKIGDRDTEVQLLRAARCAWRRSTRPTSGFSRAATWTTPPCGFSTPRQALARLEVIGARLVADREVIPQAMKLNPAFFKIVYADLLNTKKTQKNVQAALDAIDGYIAARAPALFALVIEHLREAGEARSASEIEAHFTRNFDVGGVTTACEYLAEQGLIGKASTPVRLTKKSHVELQELAFFHI